MTGVRYGELGFEGCCDGCQEWWPLEHDFWPIKSRHVHVCRACWNERSSKPSRWSYAQYRRDGGTEPYVDWLRTYKRDWMRRFRAGQRVAA